MKNNSTSIYVQIINNSIKYFVNQMNSNQQGLKSISPIKKGNFKFYSPERQLVLNKFSHLQKNKYSSPPHQTCFSPNKGLNVANYNSDNTFYKFQSSGTKSCAKIDTTAFRLIIINQEDKKSNCSNQKKSANLKFPNFYLTNSAAKDKKTQKVKDQGNKNCNETKYLNKKLYGQNGSQRSFQRIGKYFLPDIPKINFSNRTSESSQRHKSPPCALFQMYKSSNSNGKSQTRDQHNNQLYVPTHQRPKTKSLQKHKSVKKFKVPAFIRLKQQQGSEYKHQQLKIEGMESRHIFSFNNERQFQQQTNNGFQIKISIKSAIKKRSFDDFKIIKQLGTGSYGKACLAIQKKIGFICTIKIIQKNMVNQYEIKSLMRQIKIQSFLDNIHITSLYGFFDDQQNLYLILQLLPTGNLRSLTKARALPQKSASNIIFQILIAINCMHNNSIIHRDIKPENIFTFDTYMRLGDFGCAVYCDQTRRSFVGSPCYLSPQQLRKQSYDEKVDVWQIGVLTYELLFKVSPFEKDILAIIQGAQSAAELSNLIFPVKYIVSEQAKDFIRKTLQKNAFQRISIKEALLHPFVRIQAGQLQMIRNSHQ